MIMTVDSVCPCVGCVRCYLPSLSCGAEYWPACVLYLGVSGPTVLSQLLAVVQSRWHYTLNSTIRRQ